MEKKASCDLEQEKDLISKFPDDVLINIISQLPIKEAVRTCVLSHKWKNLGKFFTGYVDIEMCCVTSEACKNYVNRVLDSHHGGSMKGLRIASPVEIHSSPDIDRWIHLASAKKVQRFALEFFDGYEELLPFHHRNLVLLKLPPLDHHPRFDTLTNLRLRNVNASEEFVSYFLSNCPLLEHLSITHVRTITKLRISGANLKLKQLEIMHCFKLNDLKISAPKLAVLKYEGGTNDILSLQNVPLLSSLYLGGNSCEDLIPTRFREFSVQISQLEHLVLDFVSLVRDQPRLFHRGYPEFSNLKQLEIEFEPYKDQPILFLSLLVRAAPRLCKFTLKFTVSWMPTYLEILLNRPNQPVWMVEDYPHENLKVVEFLGWVGLESDFELAKYLLKNCVNLDKIVIDPNCPFGWYKDPRIQTMDVARQRARELLAHVPQGVELILFP